MQVVAATVSPSVIFTGGQVRAKSKVNSYAFGAQEQISVPTISGVWASERENKETSSAVAKTQLNRIL